MAHTDADDVLREFEARVDEQLAQADRLRSAMESVRVTGTVRDGAVRVTVDSSGVLADLRLSAAALERGPDRLAADILACAKAAQSRLADRIGQTVSGVLGSGSETANYVSQAYAEKFGPAEDGDPDGEQELGRRSND